MNPLRIIHVAQIPLTPTTGMGRIACEWNAAAKRKGIDFVHVGPREVGREIHPLLFSIKARKVAEGLLTERTLLLLHEPNGWAFRGMPHTKVAFSHGIELRAIAVEQKFHRISSRRKLTDPVTLWLKKRAIQTADGLLASSTEDRRYLADRGIMKEDRVRVFRNGVDLAPVMENAAVAPDRDKTIVFNGTWSLRKGTDVLIKAASLLAKRGIRPHWLLIGTGASPAEVRSAWPESLWEHMMIITNFQREDEFSLLSRASMYVLPSYFEGQSLSLLQAMAAGLCCISTECCGQKDVIRHGENGLFFPQGDHVKLADLIQEMWENPAKRGDLATQARILMEGRTWPVVTDEIMGWLQERA